MSQNPKNVLERILFCFLIRNKHLMNIKWLNKSGDTLTTTKTCWTVSDDCVLTLFMPKESVSSSYVQ